MRKRRILIANDASYLGTGYGVYGKELLSRLHNTGKYEIAEIACYATTDNKERYSVFPWKVYPNAPSSVIEAEKPELKSYASSPVNHFGQWRFDAVCSHFKPDVVFDMRDYWMFAFQEISMLRPYYKWVVMPTVDSAPQKPEWLYTFQNMDLVIPYTDWAKKTLQKQCGDSINLFPDIANAGVDLLAFQPPQDKKEIKKKILDEEDLSITGCVMRNQKRKLFPNVFKSYKQYLDRLLLEGKKDLYNKSFLYLHTSYPESTGWDIPSLLIEYNLFNKVYLTSICLNCSATYATKFHECSVICNKCQQKSCIHPSPNHNIKTDNLVQIYQTFDLFLQVAICEGFGMPQVEAAACGVPIASVDYSAMTEIVKKLEGYPIKVKTLFREMETGADRANPDNEHLAEIIYQHHVEKSENEKQKMSHRTRELCEKYYSWDGVADVWDRALSSVDISSNLSWDSPTRNVDVSQMVPKGLAEIEVVKFIIDKILIEPYIWKTAPIKKMVRDLTNGFASEQGRAVKKITMSEVVSQLEGLLKKKAVTENIRTNLQDTGFHKGFLDD